jgi:SAM-dependent methyltransferase
MKIKLNEIKDNCKICKWIDFSIITDKDRYWFKINTAICKKCWFIMTNPLPDKDFLNNFYKNDYRKYYESIWTPNEDYFLRFIGRASKRISFINDYLSDWLKYLEIWSWEWSYLWLIKQFYNIDETGIEPTWDYANYAINEKNINIKNDIYENVVLKDNYFDIISHFHVLEHIYDINHIIKENHKKLKENWLLFIEVPNVLWNWSWIWMINIAHLYNFSKISLSNLLKINWFTILKIEESNDETFWDIIRVIAKKSDNKSEIKVENYKEIKKFVLKNINRISKIEFKIITFSKKIIWDYNTKKIIKLINSYVKRK